jgi:hypothetical protein
LRNPISHHQYNALNNLFKCNQYQQLDKDRLVRKDLLERLVGWDLQVHKEFLDLPDELDLWEYRDPREFQDPRECRDLRVPRVPPDELDLWE